jgi:putative Ca2+/H+ antiporter (TMEM165/GDT1 family)
MVKLHLGLISLLLIHSSIAGILTSEDENIIGELNFLQAFFKSITMIIVTELGDKTFFIAAIMAMQNPRLVVYLGALSALIVMTILSTVIGYALPMLLPKIYVHYASIIMFLFFGSKLLKDAREMYNDNGPEKKNEELEEVELQFGVKEEKEEKDIESRIRSNSESKKEGNVKIFILAFTLTFFAEWGDRSQIATISLASVDDPIGVTLGSCIGHAACTGLAVIGGRMLASKISEKQVALAGGIVFWLFALHSIYFGP